MSDSSPSEKAKEALKKYFGYEEYRPLQEEIINSVLNNQDTVVLMPTGGGKSICFQVPALVKNGLTVVVSPLIALMKDQVEGLRANGVPAAFLNSSLSQEEQGQVATLAKEGEIKLLYVSPERLLTNEFLDFLKGLDLSLFAIDEAHCISAWGHDFRPEYTQLKILREKFPEVPIIALTATADKLTRKDISGQLAMKEPNIFIASFDRPNLSLTVVPGQKRLQTIERFIQKRPNTSGIVYCLSRKSTENLAKKLNNSGINAVAYHAGLGPEIRSKRQEDFVRDKVDVICATIAFGMGIDKSDVRWIIHYNLPKNIESYYQEIGRAGRDGDPAETLLFYSWGDVIQLRRMLEDNDQGNDSGGKSQQTEVQLAKLDRMVQYANASVCRRRILLNYFSEDLGKDCGNCDVCKHPPTYIEGTVIAQKALSAVARLGEKVATNLLIDVLRGSGKAEVRANGFDKIKTYGAGAGIPFLDWQEYIKQLLNQGLLEVAYDQGNALKLTSRSNAVLFEGEKVNLVKPEIKAKEAEKTKAAPKEVLQGRPELFEKLRVLRRDLAREKGLAPYMVFPDKTLRAMAGRLPVTLPAISRIPGVGEKKLQTYGDVFLNAVLEWVQEQEAKGIKLETEKLGAEKPAKKKKARGDSAQESYELYLIGKSVEEIADMKQIKVSTVLSHLMQMRQKGKSIDLRHLIDKDKLQIILDDLETNGRPEGLKILFNRLEGKASYDELKIAMAIWEG